MEDECKFLGQVLFIEIMSKHMMKVALIANEVPKYVRTAEQILYIVQHRLGVKNMSNLWKLNFDAIAQGHPNAASASLLMQKFLTKDGSYKFCTTCKNAIAKNNTPKICLANSLNFPEIPDCFEDLTPTKERLIMPRIGLSRAELTDTIRPSKVMKVLQFLVNTLLYREHNIRIRQNWISVFNNQQ